LRFHHDFALENEACGKTAIFVCRPGVTVNAAVLAPTIWIHACLETYIRAVIASNNRFSSIAKILGCAPAPLFRVRVNIHDIDVRQIYTQLFEAVCRAPGRATPADGRTALRRLLNNRPEYLFCRHVISSHEHIAPVELNFLPFENSITPIWH